MSSCPTAPTSTTGSSTSWHFRRGRGAIPLGEQSPPGEQSPIEIIACGALAAHIREIVARRNWPAAVHTLPALLHNHPKKIADYAERAVRNAQANHHSVVVAYADCGTYGALDEVCERYGVKRLPGLHCYDMFAGPKPIENLFADEPGTYLLTDFLVRSFDRVVLAELGLDRYPELWNDYFGHYRRLVWLAQEPTDGLAASAQRIAERFALPLTRVNTGVRRLERELARLIAPLPAAPRNVDDSSTLIEDGR
jgi:hypothetical protein